MADQYTIKTFTAADIEKYHTGQLSATEMHSMEKAALDDPFLADALEGYTMPGVNVREDIAELKKRLTEKTEESKVVPLVKTKRRAYWWLRIAAMIVIVAGAGFLVYQFGWNNKDQHTVAQTTNQNKKRDVLSTDKDSNKTANNLKADSADSKETKGLVEKNKDFISTQGNGHYVLPDPGGLLQDSISLNLKSNPPVYYFSPSEANDAIAKKESGKKKNVPTNTDSTLIPAGNAKAIATLNDTGKDGIIDDLDKNVAANSSSREQEQGAVAQQVTLLPRNVFRGRITDDNNNPLPFANVTNAADNVGTYANAKGYFTLTSPDSVLNVQVRSVGFNNSNVLLRSDTSVNDIVMAEDNNSLQAVIINNNRNLNSTRSRTNTMVLEEPEPVDGWHNYDTYIANNLNIPESYKTRQPAGGEVVISFEVSSNGEPINLKIEKSLCESCDIEAMRLVREGPKFKRKAKRKGRTTVSVSF